MSGLLAGVAFGLAVLGAIFIGITIVALGITLARRWEDE